MQYLLDTDIASYLIKGRANEQLLQHLEKLPLSRIAISVITKSEILYGLKRLEPKHKLHVSAASFLKHVQTIPLNEEAATWYANIRYQLKTDGYPIGEMDMLIASHALSMEATLITNNMRHYQYVQAPLLLENWMEN